MENKVSKLNQLKCTLDEVWSLYEHYEDVTEIHTFTKFLNNEIKKLEEVKVENPFDIADKIDELVDFVDEEYNMELVTNRENKYDFEEVDKFPTYFEMCKKNENATEFDKQNFECFKDTYKQIDKHRGQDRKAIYALHNDGLWYGQAYIVVSKELEFIDIIYTI